MRSFLREATNFYSIISSFDEVVPYIKLDHPANFLHFTRTLTSKFAYWAKWRHYCRHAICNIFVDII